MARFDDQAFRLQNKSTEKAFEDKNIQMGVLPEELHAKDLLKTYEGYQKYDTAVANAKKFRQKKSSSIVVVIVLIVLVVLGVLAFIFWDSIENIIDNSPVHSSEILSSNDSSEEISSSSSNTSSASSSKENFSSASSKSLTSSTKNTESIPGVISLSTNGYSVDLLSIISEADLPSTGTVSANTLELANEDGEYGMNQKLVITSNNGKDSFLVGRFYAFSAEDASSASQWIQANLLAGSDAEPVIVYADDTVAIYFVTEEDGKTLNARVKGDKTLSSAQDDIDALGQVIQENGSNYIKLSVSSKARNISSSPSSKNNSSSGNSSSSGKTSPATSSKSSSR